MRNKLGQGRLVTVRGNVTRTQRRCVTLLGVHAGYQTKKFEHGSGLFTFEVQEPWNTYMIGNPQKTDET